MNMLNTLQNENEIENAQKKLESELKGIADEKITVRIGNQGGSQKADVFYSKKYDLWFYLGDEKGDGEKKRYWNVFGIKRPNENSNVSPVVQINPPLKRIYRRVAGVFAKDDKSDIFLLHRGIIGGGRKGIGKKTFCKHYNGEKSDLQDGDKLIEILLIGCITSPNFPEKLKNFVGEVDRIKKDVHPK